MSGVTDNLDPRRIKRNIDAKVVTSVVVGLGVFGLITYLQFDPASNL